MRFEITEVFTILIIFHLLIFAAILFFVKGKNKYYNGILGLFFLSLGLNIFSFLMHSNYPTLPDFFVHLVFLGSPFAYLYAPLFFLYIKSITSDYKVYSFKNLPHLIPFIAFTSYLCVVFNFKDIETKIYLLHNYKVLPHFLFLSLTALLQIQVFTYLVFIIIKVKQYRKNIKNYFSSTEKVGYKWLRSFILILVFLYAVDIIRLFSRFFSYKLVMFLEITLICGFIAMCYWIIFKAISNEVVILKTDTIKSKVESEQYVKLRIKYLETLQLFMQKEKPYLNPDLTLNDLSKLTEIPPRSLSELLNNQLNKSFYDYINTFRINEARIQLEQSNKTVLEILYEVGFNSKSSFNTSFKKNTKLTPTQYRNKNFSKAELV